VLSLASVGEEEACHLLDPMNSLNWMVGHMADHEHDWRETSVTLLLPRHSLELNPAEHIFRALPPKLANRIFTDLAALEASLIETFQPL